MTGLGQTNTNKGGGGGRRRGAGRKPGPDTGVSKVTTVVLTEQLIKQLRELGGSRWIRNKISEGYRALKENDLLTLTLQLPKNANESYSLRKTVTEELDKNLLFQAPDDKYSSHGIEAQDLLIVDEKHPVVDGVIVLVRQGEERYLGLVKVTGDRYFLETKTDAGETVLRALEKEEVIGVATQIIKQVR